MRWNTLPLFATIVATTLPLAACTAGEFWPDGTDNITSDASPVSGFFVNDPDYQAISDFDFQSISLALHQDYIELDMFLNALSTFSVQDFSDAGLDEADMYLIRFMAGQEVGHIAVLSNILGPRAASMCNYTHPYNDVRGFVDFAQKLTRWGESGVYGFLEQLDNRASAQILLQSVATEARQQVIFRQFEGLFPMPVWFEPAITPSMMWTLLSRYITSCPGNNTPIAWNIFPRLNVTNNPYLANLSTPGISSNLTFFTYGGRITDFAWENPGTSQGPYGQTTNTLVQNSSEPRWAAWFSQLNVTYTPLTVTGNNTGSAPQPNSTVLGDAATMNGSGIPLINGTIFIALTTENPFLTPANLSLINDYIVAGPEVFQAG